jgi:putative RNA 2'-phosphotransferase
MTHDVRMSKRLSLWLRHRPKEAGLSLDAQGWADTQSVLAALQAAGLPFTASALQAVVDHNDKQRFEFSDDGTRIRARQGHTMPVQLQ